MQAPQPAVEVQGGIVDYLDRETAQIDALISKQEQLIDKLFERRHAIVESATTARSDGRGARFKHYVQSVRQGWSPQCFSWAADGVNDWAVLKAGATNGGIFRPDENKALPPEEAPRSEAVVGSGDLVVSRANTRDLVGSAAVVKGTFPRLMLSDKHYAFRMDASRVAPEYVSLILGTRAWRDLIELEATGSSPSMQNISQADILNLPLSLPPIEEQQSRLTQALGKTGQIDGLIAKTRQFIALTRERRSALITAAVTGQIDVRESA